MQHSTFSVVLAVLGILFMQYFSTCVLAMRDKLNPGVLWVRHWQP